MHAALAITLAALGAIFRAFPALCPCEPRPARGEMQALHCCGCSDSRSQLLDLLKSAIRKYNTGICLYVEVKTDLIFSETSSYPAKINTPAQPRPDTFVPRRARARASGK